MFSYYGGKSKVVRFYPKPKYNLIIEPFAGSAVYSYNYGLDRNVWLNDKYEVIYKIWKYLTNCNRQQIENIPNLKKGDNIKNFNLLEEEKLLLGFVVGNGRAAPGYKVTSFGDKTHYPKDDPRWRPNSTWTLTRNRILKNLDYIKKWKVTNLDYRDIENVEATWFIDAPYQFGGEHYVENKINFNELAEWCKSRKGQVIVCENSKANWLPFKFLAEMSGCQFRTTEVIWTNEQNNE